MSINLEGLTPVKTIRFGGQVDWDDPTQIPNGLALVCQNMQFLAESVKTRWGLRTAAVLAGLMANATGADFLTVLGSPQAPVVKQQAGGAAVSVGSLNPSAIVGNNQGSFLPIAPKTQIGLVFSDTGELLLELPAGSGNLVAMDNTRIADMLDALLPTGAVMQTAKAYNRIYQAFTDLVSSQGPVLALDAATGFESPVGQNPIAAAWQPNTLYQQGDLITPTANPAVWFRRRFTGYSGAVEPQWPATQLGVDVPGIYGFFLPGYIAQRAGALDAGPPVGDTKWEEWTPGFPSYLPPPRTSQGSGNPTVNNPGGGTIPANQDVYIYLAYFNDLGESAWSAYEIFSNTAANDAITIKPAVVLTAGPAGPPMPSWLLAVMNKGTVGGLHWPAAQCINVYVASVATGGMVPTMFRLYGTVTADNWITVTSIPGAGTQYTVRTIPTAAISSQSFKGESGTRNAIVLRQDTMGNLSPADPRAPLGVNFVGAQSVFSPSLTVASGTLYVGVPDITQFAPGLKITISNPSLAALLGTYAISAIWADTVLGLPAGSPPTVFPQGTLVVLNSGLSNTGATQTGTVSTVPGPCPVAVLPPGTPDGPGYSYDIVALTVAGIGKNGPFNYLAEADPVNPFSTTILSETTDGNGNAYANVSDSSGLVPGADVLIAGYTGGHSSLNGPRVLASVSNGVVAFPDPALAATATGGSAVTMSVVQSQPTQAVAGTLGILLQFDDTTLPQGVNVTGNLLFVALPPCTDLAYLPSVSRMAYVSDLFPTSLIFSEADFLGEIDGLNDVLSVEASNSAILVGAREMLNGMIVAAKRTGGYQIVPTADDPAHWGINRLWGIHGPQSGRNIATGRDGSTGLDYFIFVDPEAGLFRWPPSLGEGELDWLSKELSGANNQDAARMATWDRVNRAAGAQIQVVVDDIAKEIKVAVPLDGASTPTHILTMSYFNGWASPLMMTMSGEWVPRRDARRWNLDPIPTRCMVMAQRTLATPVDQRVNYHQLLLGGPSILPGTVVSAAALQQVTNQAPTIASGQYYVQIAKVQGGNEVAWSPVLGPFAVQVVNLGGAQGGQGGGWLLTTVQLTLPGDGLEDGWTLYFGNSALALNRKLSIPNNVASYTLSQNGAPTATQPQSAVGLGLEFMQPGVYDDLGAGYVPRYRPAYTREAPNQEWPAGGRFLRFSAVTGLALGAGNMTITAVTDDPNYQPDPKVQSLDGGKTEVPGSAPVTHFDRSLKDDSEFLTCEFSTDGAPGSWFQLMEYISWHKALRPSR